MQTNELITLWRPVGPGELKLIEESGFKRFPKRLAEQPIFYPSAFLAKYNVENVGGPIHNELWVPAEELEEFNDNIIGLIEVTQSFYPETGN